MPEIECKFRVHPWFELPDLAGTPGVDATGDTADRVLTATYYDTGDLRLAREGITLRHRSGESEDPWTLKLPVGITGSGAGVRDELTEAQPDGTPPARLRSLVTAWVRFTPLLPVATLVTERHLVPLLGADGQRVAELVDDRVEVREGGHAVARFREIEVEDKGGGDDILAAVSEALVAAGAVGGEFVPKAVRALGPRASAAPDPPPPGPVERRDAAAVAVAANLRRHVRALMAADVAVRRGAPGGVHDLRVAGRRLRSGLSAFAPLLDPEWSGGLREELGWLTDAFAAPHTAEVALGRLLTRLDEMEPEDVRGPARAQIEEALQATLAELPQTIESVLGSERYIALLQRLVDGATFPRVTDAAAERSGDVLPGLVAAAYRKLSRRVAALGRRPDVRDYHEVRIAAKHARYTTEAAVPVLGKPARKLAADLADLQDILGEHRDALEAAQVARGLAGAPRARSAGFTLGVLYAAERTAAGDAAARFAAAWPALARRRVRRTLSA